MGEGPDEIRQRIENERRELTETLRAIRARADVKARVSARIQRASRRFRPKGK
jgi:hypothetical protein